MNQPQVDTHKASSGTDQKLGYYLGLPYVLEIRPLEHGDGYYASYPELGAHGDAPTLEEAIEEANISKALMLESYLEGGDYPIPLPESMRTYSGKFNVRVPKTLHRKLVVAADAEGVSLNQLVVSLLSSGVRNESR